MAFKTKLAPLDTWCASHIPMIPQVPSQTLIQYTNTLIHQLTSTYYTHLSPHKPSKPETRFADMVNPFTSPSDHSFLDKTMQLKAHTHNGENKSPRTTLPSCIGRSPKESFSAPTPCLALLPKEIHLQTLLNPNLIHQSRASGTIFVSSLLSQPYFHQELGPLPKPQPHM